MRRGLPRRLLSLALCFAQWTPSPLLAQQVAPVNLGTQSLGAAGTAAAGLGALQGPSFQGPTLGLSALDLSLGSSLSAGPAYSLNSGAALSAGTLSAPAASLGGSAPLSASARLRAAKPAAGMPAREGLGVAARALGQDPEAGRAMPSLAGLGLPDVRAASESNADQRIAADIDFMRRARIAYETGVPIDDTLIPASGFEISGRVGGTKVPTRRRGSGGGGGGRGGDEGEPPAPKYPSRDVEFNGVTLPSVAMLPDQKIEPLNVKAIDAAKDSIVLAAYEFKSREMLNALRRAKRRFDEENAKHKGDKNWIPKSIKIIVDYSAVFPKKYPNSKYTPRRSIEMQALLNEGFDVTILRGMWKYGIMHNKFMVLDGKLAQFGSYNYTWITEGHHYENSKFSKDKRHIKAFLAFWDYMRKVSVPFEQAREHAWPKEMPPAPQDTELGVVHNGVQLPTWFFSPGGNGEDWIVKAIGSAKKSINISMFTFRSTRIAQALVAAKKNNKKLKIRVILDRSQFENEDFEEAKLFGEYLAYHGIEVRTLAGPDPNGIEIFQKNHNKFVIIDDALVATGSMNWTKNASIMNFENGFFSNDEIDAKAYSMFFKDLYRKAEAIDAPRDEPELPSDEQLAEELLEEPTIDPPPIQWPLPPAGPSVKFNDTELPAVLFRPQHAVASRLAQAVDHSQESILLALYEFNLQEVLESLRAKKKQFDAENAKNKKNPKWKERSIRIVLDYSHVYPKGMNSKGQPRERSEQIQKLIDDGFDVRVVRGLKSTGIMHNKFAVFDGKMVEFGSFNWTETSENDHFEDVQFNTEKERVAFYEKLWQHVYDAGVSFEEAADFEWKSRDVAATPRDTDRAIEFNGAMFPRTAGSPDGGVLELDLLAINSTVAGDAIDIAMFAYYSQEIADALVAAKERGVEVRLLFDASQARTMKLDEWFAYHDFQVRLLAGPDRYGNVYYQKMHMKYMRIRGKKGGLLKTGSYNATPNAENNNFENANYFNDPALLALYDFQFDMMFNSEDVSEPRKPKQAPAGRAKPSQFFILKDFNRVEVY
ncbi:MAG: hypothetical protein HY078_12300 [Elusimicrobia bacterium]|nr:hypothetical protein [Elusimicrobiota bacterium]